MAKLLLILVLVITIPRWAMTLAQVDTFTIAGIPITAIGEGIVLEIACYLLIQAHGNAYEEAQRYRAWIEAHKARMEEQGKQNRKPGTDPELAGYGQLMILYYALLVLTIISQWPFLMSALTGQPVTELLRWWAQWAYTLFLVVAPEIVTFALARALHYGRICARKRAERDTDAQDAHETRTVWAFLGVQLGNIAYLLEQVRTLRPQAGTPAPNAPDDAPIMPDGADDLTVDARRGALMRLYARQPMLKPAQVAPMFGVDRRTIGRDLRALERAGRIKRNGQGVEILQEVAA